MIRIFHWWPGREYRGVCPIPSYLVREAEEKGTRYLTFVSLEMNDLVIEGVAECCPKDVPSRKMGRKIALGRLKSLVKHYGLEVDDGLL